MMTLVFAVSVGVEEEVVAEGLVGVEAEVAVITTIHMVDDTRVRIKMGLRLRKIGLEEK